MVNQAFLNKGFQKKGRDYFFNNPTEYVMQMRDALWTEYKLLEKHFNAEMAKVLVEHSNINQLLKILSDPRLTNVNKVKGIVSRFTENFDQHLYDLNLSNTQSRRSRAGKEFEYAIYKLLIHSKILCDDQGILGNERFQAVGLGKLVDFAIPGVKEYKLEKHKCALVSMKTTLRERWAEVPEELNRTGAQSMYLLTLDDSISKNKINTIYNHNVHLVVPDSEKDLKYADNPKVYGLSSFMSELDNIIRYWSRKKANYLGQGFYKDKIEMYQYRIERTSIHSEISIYREFITYFEKKITEIN
ncbi:type II restriction endonuclease [Peribacillus glennii]|nr:type II restriction endonuclease [Peribacillus glennii]